MSVLAQRFRLVVLACVVACGDDLGPRVPAAIAVTPEAPRVLLAGTLQLQASVVDASARQLDGHSVTFASSDTAVLTVTGSGLLTSRGSIGSSIITLTSGDLTAHVQADVVYPPSSLIASPSSLKLNTDELGGVGFFVTEKNGVRLRAAEVDVRVSDPAILRVEPTDYVNSIVYVTAIAPGSATITLTSGELTAEVPVTVGRFPSSLEITPSDLVLSPGGSRQVSASLLDRLGEPLDPPSPFTWSSSNEAVVTVSPSGVVASVGGEGWALITATTDTFTATQRVFVGTPPAGEMLARVELSWAAGLAVTADGQYFAAGADAFVRGALPAYGFPVQIPVEENRASDVVVNADVTRAYLVLGNSPAGVVIVDLTTNTRVGVIPVHLGSSFSGALSADGSVLTIGTSHGFERFDVATERSLGGTAAGFVFEISRHPSKPLLYTSGSAGAFEIDDRSGEIVRRFEGEFDGHVVSPDGSRLYAVNFFGGGIGVWNLETGAREATLGSGRGTDVAITPDGRFLYLILGSSHIAGNSRLFIVDAASGTVVREVVTGGLANRIVMAADGTAIISNEGAVAGELGWLDFVR